MLDQAQVRVAGRVGAAAALAAVLRAQDAAQELVRARESVESLAADQVRALAWAAGRAAVAADAALVLASVASLALEAERGVAAACGAEDP
jgi:hypothetical protein